jgi:hypothetical protein
MVALYQLARVRAAAESALLAAKATQEDMKLLSSKAQIADGERLTEVIKLALEQRNYLLAEIRLSDLRDLMTRLEVDISLREIAKEDRGFTRADIEEIATHQKSLQLELSRKGKVALGYQPERLVDCLLTVRGKLQRLGADIQRKEDERTLVRR